MIRRSLSNARVAQALKILVLAASLLGLALNATGLIFPGPTAEARLIHLITLVPMLFYLAGVWTIHRAFAALAKGAEVSAILAGLLARIGACLFLGGLARVFGEPWLIRLALDRPWPYGNFDLAAITLGAVGLLLILLTAPLREAAAMRTELAEIL